MFIYVMIIAIVILLLGKTILCCINAYKCNRKMDEKICKIKYDIKKLQMEMKNGEEMD